MLVNSTVLDVARSQTSGNETPFSQAFSNSALTNPVQNNFVKYTKNRF